MSCVDLLPVGVGLWNASLPGKGPRLMESFSLHEVDRQVFEDDHFFVNICGDVVARRVLADAARLVVNPV